MNLPRPLSLATLALFSALCALAVGFRSHLEAVHAQSRLTAAASEPTQSANHVTPVLVELFTSEGCSSCPPADDVLAGLEREQPIAAANIIVLSEHIDYWDGPKFRDRFSSPVATDRQKTYANGFKLRDVYTPEAVVDGTAEFNGADREGLQKAIAQAALTARQPLRLTGVEVRGTEVAFTLAELPAHAGSLDIYAALVDPEDTTEVHGGENKGRTLHHVAVVRTMSLAGTSSPSGTRGDHRLVIHAKGAESLDGMRLVVFAQTKHLGPVVGAVACMLVPATTRETAPSANRCPTPRI
ncbi:MAG: DUF1223 domain-containing protein [Acidobacteriaceae bacterium]